MADELEEIRRRRMQQLMAQQMQGQQQEAMQEQMREAEINSQIKLIIGQILSPEARERLSNIRLARPSQARQIEILLIQLKQAGRLPAQLTDKDFKEILLKITGTRREGKVSYNRPSE
ncbi:MAG: DNA-binding protein [Candidatus Altiarchaeota archaeon]|nr:DNA-binding protein [Candidatus Altiarchaeota archaeon]